MKQRKDARFRVRRLEATLTSRSIPGWRQGVALQIFAIVIFTLSPTTAGVLQNDNSVDAFWGKFKQAVVKGDKARVADMTAFPVGMPYGVSAIKTRSQLLSRYQKVFHGETNAAKCFAGAKPHQEPNQPREFTIGCDNGSGQEVIIYRFVLTKTGWRFKSLDNINE